jgi:hypothetical protein
MPQYLLAGGKLSVGVVRCKMTVTICMHACRALADAKTGPAHAHAHSGSSCRASVRRSSSAPPSKFSCAGAHTHEHAPGAAMHRG